eukprot:UN24951
MLISGDEEEDTKRHKDLIIRQMQPPEMQYELILVVDNILVGSIIGKKGAQLRKFSEESGGAEIQIQSEAKPQYGQQNGPQQGPKYNQLGESQVE